MIGTPPSSKGWVLDLTGLLIVLLAVQNVTAGLLVQMAREDEYSRASAIFVGEIVKVAMSLASLYAGGETTNTILHTLRNIKPLDSLKLAVPAIIYTFQNNLIFLSIDNIPSALFQVFSQLKILSTALFSVTMLGRSLHRIQWVGLCVLICGVSTAQLKPTCPSPPSLDDSPTTTTTFSSSNDTENNYFIGISAVLMLCVLSGFAGVYQEKIVKKNMTYPIHYLNLQLCMYSIITNLFSILIQDGSSSLLERGLLYGFTWRVWTIVFVQASGGILVSLVIKYTSNLAKSYCVSASVFLTGLFSYLFLDFELSLNFLFGAILATCSVILYNEPSSWTKEEKKMRDVEMASKNVR